MGDNRGWGVDGNGRVRSMTTSSEIDVVTNNGEGVDDVDDDDVRPRSMGK